MAHAFPAFVNRLLIPLAVVMALTAVTPCASGQTLAERLQAVQRRRAAERPARSPRVKLLQVVLYGRVSVDFRETPARDVFAYLGTTLGVTLTARYSDDRAGHGIDPETPITISLDDAPVPQVLELVLEQCATVEKCTWQVRGSFLEVGTRERLSSPSAQEMRVYPVASLLFEPTHFDDAPPMGIDYGPYNHDPVYDGRSGGGFTGSVQIAGSGGGGNATDRSERGRELVDLIVDSIEPEAWQINGGEWATIRYRDGVLIVRAPDYIHRQINGYPGVPKPAIPAGGARTPPP